MNDHTDRSFLVRSAVVLSVLLISFLTFSGPAATSAYIVPIDDMKMENPLDEDFSQYMDHPALTEYLETMVGNHSDIASLSSVGSTYEGREIWCVKVSDHVEEEDDGGSDPEPNVLLVGAHHGNEWISYEVPLYVLAFLLKNYGGTDINGSMATNIVEGRETYIVPMLNADGVQYSFDSGRGFRKNREPNYLGDFLPTEGGGPEIRPTSYGADINRNYGWMWHLAQGSNALDQAGSSYRGAPDNVDDDNDATLPIDWRPGYTELGPEDGVDEDPWDGADNDGDGKMDEDPAGGFSTAEAKAMRDLGDEIEFDALITYHSFSELVLWPWGYTGDPCPDAELFETLGTRLARFNGYEPLQGYDLYMTSGEMTDWFYAVYGTLAFTYEIGRAYAPDEEEIIDECVRNLESTLYLCHASKNPSESYIEFDQNSSIVEAGKDSVRLSVSFKDTGYPVPFDDSACKVVYKDSSGRDSTAPLIESAKGRFEAEIPTDRIGIVLSYYYRLVDTEGKEVTYPTYAPHMRLTAHVPGVPFGGSLSCCLLGILALIVLSGGIVSFAMRRIRKGRKH